jgi:hypothetical protein
VGSRGARPGSAILAEAARAREIRRAPREGPGSERLSRCSAVLPSHSRSRYGRCSQEYR